MRFAITLLTHRRPHYLAQTLSSFLNLQGLERWDYFAILDRPDSATLRMIKQTQIPFILNMLLPERGTDEYDTAYKRISFMTYHSIDTAFARGADFVFHLEEDIVPNQELLRFIEFNAGYYKDNKDVFTINAWSSPKRNGDTTSELHKWFTPWGWGTWKDRWEEMSAKWSFARWDQELNERMRGERYGVFPVTSLTKNIGAIGTQPLEEYLERESN